MCGVGGDLFAMIWSGGELVGLNSSGALPEAAHLPEAGVPERGAGSATVPGAPAGWVALAERFGSIPLFDLARPAAALAREGVERSPGLARYTAAYAPLLENDPDAARIYLAERLVQEELAGTLDGLDSFYDGDVAAGAPEPFSKGDFQRHEPRWVSPLSETFAGLEINEMPPNSRGHLALEAIRRLESLEGLTPDDPEWHARLIRALDAAIAGGDTVYLCAVDPSGMAVSLNQSLYMSFGSGVVIPGTGVLLHNRAAYFSPETYRGGATPTHTLAPAMALRHGRPHLVFGTMGGEGQVQIHLQILARIALAGQSVEDAIAAPRWILKGDVVVVEDGLPRLQEVVPFPTVRPPDGDDTAGHAHAIRLSEGFLEAAADPRADGVPVGF